MYCPADLPNKWMSEWNIESAVNLLRGWAGHMKARESVWATFFIRSSTVTTWGRIQSGFYFLFPLRKIDNLLRVRESELTEKIEI